MSLQLGYTNPLHQCTAKKASGKNDKLIPICHQFISLFLLKKKQHKISTSKKYNSSLCDISVTKLL